MTIGITKFHHVNVTVPRNLEEAAKEFYDSGLGLKEVPKPEASRGRGGAWYQFDDVQLHLSVEEDGERKVSTRHICFLVRNLKQAEKHLASAGIEILPDPRPDPETHRFYVRDPGANLIEIAERKTG
jgi:catechol 2,3-dioxygenase-like lactoylglutathione lyase family enzyme